MKTKYYHYLLLLISFCSMAQTKPQNFVLGSYPAQSTTSYNAIGYLGINSGGNPGSMADTNNYRQPYSYLLNYGTINGSNPGLNRTVKTFNVEGYTYTLTKAVPGAKPFKKVLLERFGDNPPNKLTALFESSGRPPLATGPGTINLIPDYVDNMEDLINSYVINRGTDNLLNRYTADNTWNNIVRVDMLLETSVVIPSNQGDREKSGFLLMERGGNDTFKAAAITGVDSDGNPTAFGPLISVQTSNWGFTGHNMWSVVVQRDPSDGQMRPSQRIAPQPIAGVFINLADLGVEQGKTIYGISIIDSQSTSATVFPTIPAQGANGLDFMAGGGFFTKAILIKGTVWIDKDEDAIKNDGSGSGTNNGNTLWANLVGPDDKVISSIEVDANGDFTLFVAETQRVAGNYKVILTNNEKYEGENLVESDDLLNGFYHTGSNFQGTANTADKNGIIEIGSLDTQTEDMEGIDFGINRVITPVTLVDFNAKQEENHVNLQWTTTSETNNAGFEVEFSEDGRNWNTLGFVKASTIDGNSEDRNVYSFMHLSPVFGQNYYRLKQIDHDGTFAYSPIRALKVSISHLLVWPNPSSGHIKVAVSDAQASQIKSMKVVDMSGRILKEASSYIENWDISDLKSDAFYILRVDYKNNFSEQIRIYKR